MGIVNRINAFINGIGENPNSLAKLLNVPQSSVDAYIKGQRKLSVDFIEKILAQYSDLSAEWLIRGVGEMYNTPKIVSEEQEAFFNEPMKDLGREQYENMLRMMKKMQSQIDNLETKVG